MHAYKQWGGGGEKLPRLENGRATLIIINLPRICMLHLQGDRWQLLSAELQLI